ncbi:MAG: 2-oxo acid dehydrogenase subunit E2 [Chitinophagales bacterium]|jgi:pyruvate dehydrogenase E2 component (dihydrolipoamide acetyltransferase)
MQSASEFNTDWRKVAASLYQKPTDSKIFGSVDLDVTLAEEFVNEQRKKGLKITLTHILLLAIARGIKTEAPELNCYVKRGQIVQRPSIDASLSVIIRGEREMSSVLVRAADTLTLSDLVRYLETEIPATRKGQEKGAMKMKKILAAIPWPFRTWLLAILRNVTVNWGLSLPKWGISANSFGTFVLSNIGSVGLDSGYPALLPSSNVSIVLIMGSVHTKPAVVHGEIVPRKILNLSAALDHRVVDAVHGGRLFKAIKAVLRDPHQLLDTTHIPT